MPTYTLKGRLISQLAGQTLPALAVEAFFRAENQVIDTKKETSNANGVFTIPFTDALFPNPQEGLRIDVSFQVSYQDRPLPSQGSIKNLKPRDTEVNIYVEFPESEGAERTVSGIIRNQEQEPLVGKVVIAYDQGLDEARKLGSDVSNGEGLYRIAYRPDQLTDPQKQSADLRLKVFDVQGQLLLESPLRCNAAPEEVMDLVVSIARESIEFVEYITRLNAIIGEKSPADLNEDNLQFCHCKTGISLLHLKFLQLDAVYSKKIGIGPGVFYGLLRQGLPTALERLYGVAPDRLREAIKASIREHIVSEYSYPDFEQLLRAFKKKRRPDKQQVLALRDISHKSPAQIREEDPKYYSRLVQKARAELKQQLEAYFADSSDALRYHIQSIDLNELNDQEKPIKDFLREQLSESGLSPEGFDESFAKLDAFESPATIGEIIREDTPLSENPLFRPDLEQADVFRITACSNLKDGVARELLSRNITEKNLGPDKIRDLINEGMLTAEEGNRLNMTANVYSLTEGDQQLLEAIITYQAQGTIRSFSDLARLELEDWENILRSVYTEAEPLALEKSARRRQRQVEVIYPHRAFMARSRTGEKEDLRDLMTQFYQANENIPFLSLNYQNGSEDLGKINLAGFSDSEKENILHHLKVNQSLYGITHNAADTFHLKRSGYEAPHEIAFDSYANFVRTTGWPADLVARYYDKAQWSMVNLGVAMGNLMTTLDNPLTDSMVDGTSRKVKESLRRSLGNLLTDSMVDGTSRELERSLRRIDGYAVLSRGADYCKCAHCASILSPAAYFVDLMEFLQVHVMDRYFNTPPDEHPILSPRRRRPDLWEELKLSCETTHTLVPYLTIINEVLENFIFSREHEMVYSLPARTVIENAVYEWLSKSEDTAVLRSFSQPFNLPHTQLGIYLRHFSMGLNTIAKTLLAGTEDTGAVLPRLALNLSQEEYDLTVTDRSANLEENRSFIEHLYRITASVAGTIPRQNVQDLLQTMEIDRATFGDLIKTYFITANHTESLKVVGERTTGSLQINEEYLEAVEGSGEIPLGIFDRMHRFIRLWRRLDWSVAELDRILSHLHRSHERPDEVRRHLLPDQLVRAAELQKELKLSVDELCTLIYELPTASSPSFFDKRFNLSVFIREDPDRWSSPNLVSGGLEFQHPAYRPSGPDSSAEDTLLHRLLAGLGIDNEELFLLIEQLQEPLAAISSGEKRGTFTLNIRTLSLLYRHALLLKKYKLPAPQLFFLIRTHPALAADHISGLEDMESLDGLLKWQRASDYSVEELAFMLGDAEVAEDVFPDAKQAAYAIWSQIQTDQSLVFADTLFAYFEGITEAQSRSIIRARANSDLFEPANLGHYRTSELIAAPTTFNFVFPATLAASLSSGQRLQLIGRLLTVVADHLAPETPPIEGDTLATIAGIAEDEALLIMQENHSIFEPIPGTADQFQLSASVLNDPSQVGLRIPADIWSALDKEEQQELYSAMLEQIARSIQPGAPEVSDRIWVGIAGLTLAQSRAIFAANASLFEQAESATLYWLSTAFTPNRLISIPAGVPLPQRAAQQLLLDKFAGEILLNQFAAHLGVSSEKVKALASLSGFEFSDPAFSAVLTRILQGTDSFSVLEEMTEVLQKMSVWFKDRIFDPASLAFISRHSGDYRQIFNLNGTVDFLNPAWEHLRDVEDYRLSRKNLTGDVDALHTVLTGFNFSGPDTRFSEAALDHLHSLIPAEKSLLTALNNVLSFPVVNAAGDPANRALHALRKLVEAIELVQYLGIAGEILPLFVSGDFDELTVAVQAVLTAIRTKYDREEEWEEKIGPLEDKIREHKRDALTDHLIHSFRYDDDTTSEMENIQWFKTPRDLYNYFLIDTELEGCARTSRLVAGISSLQLYIQRCLMNLEQSRDGTIHVEPKAIPAEEWGWRKNYRVWEANRKVFLYAENYIEPDLRDNKTEQFKELESELLQQEISTDNALKAYAKYVKGFEEIASLKLAGAYHEIDIDKLNNEEAIDQARDTLHLFGVNAADPPVFYYRSIKNLYKNEKDRNLYGITYNHWTKVDIQIPVKKVTPVVHNGKFYVFWVEISTKPKTEMLDGTNQFIGYEHKLSVKFSSLQIDGTWQAPQKIQLRPFISGNGEGIIWDPLIENLELSHWLAREEWTYEKKLRVFAELQKKLRSSNNILNVIESFRRIGYKYALNYEENDPSTAVYVTDDSFLALLKPKYELDGLNFAQLHIDPKDDYTLRTYRWDRIFTEVDSAGNLVLRINDFRFAIDLYLLKSMDPDTIPVPSDLLSPKLKRLTGAFESGILDYIMLPDADQASYWDAIRLTKERHTGEVNLLNGSSIPKINIINGALTDAILEYNNDLVLEYNNDLVLEDNDDLALEYNNDLALTYNQDVLYLQSTGLISWHVYALRRLGTTLAGKISKRFFAAGIDGLLDIRFQEKELKEYPLPTTPKSDQVLDRTLNNVGQMDTKGPMGVYFREIFFHIPFTIANHLNSRHKFAEAQRWYHYIFDPTSGYLPEMEEVTDPLERQQIMARRVWQFIEFRNHDQTYWFKEFNDQTAIATYRNDPFNPHAVARMRLDAYRKAVVMKYIDNLLDWGDHLFAQDTMESINEATTLYLMASEILGPRPAELGNCEQESGEPTYQDLKAKMEGFHCRRFLQAVEREIVDTASKTRETGDADENVSTAEIDMAIRKLSSTMSETTSGSVATEEDEWGDIRLPSYHGLEVDNEPAVVPPRQPGGLRIPEPPTPSTEPVFLPSVHTSFLKQVCIFCIPRNPELLAYWDRVEDRLFKIRNCMNFSGVRRQLSLFAPEIDPRLLVRAKAAGLSLNDVLDSIQGDLPPYRFPFLLAKAKEYAGALQSYGVSLQATLEKKNAEDLSILRLKQQDEILKVFTAKLRRMEIDAATASLEGLVRRQKSILDRRDYFQHLIDTGLNNWELRSQTNRLMSAVLKESSLLPMLTSTSLRLSPSIVGFSISTPTDSVANAGDAFAAYMQHSGHLLEVIAQLQSITAGQKRREEGWKFSLQQAHNDLSEIEKQIEVAKFRKDIAVSSLELHEKNIEQQQEIYEFHRDKFTNLGLYTWMSTHLQRLHREAYQNVMTIARMAERAYRFERNDDTTPLLENSYWDAAHAGILSGERLLNDLRTMELRYLETHTRNMEIDQAFSLTQIDPLALLTLKMTGRCVFSIPELYFDLYYPGHYCRLIKTVRLTIPCITGPYTNVSATLTLTGSQLRKEPKLGREYLIDVPPSRSTTIATSTAQNDAGVFNLNFGGERYLPFEGAGAISSWELSLPETFRPFDYATISDVIIHISYTAKRDTTFVGQVDGELGTIAKLLSDRDFTLSRMFSLRQEFSQTFHRLLHSPTDEASPVQLELSEKHFPLFLQGKQLDIVSAELILEIDENGFRAEDGTVSLPESYTLGLQVEANGSGDTGRSVFHRAPETGIIREALESSTFKSFRPAAQPLNISFLVTDPGDFLPPAEADPSTLDDHKLSDIYLLVNYRVG